MLNKDRILFLDLDETLVFSRRRLDHSVKFMDGDEECYTALRPSTAAFLEDVSKKYRLMAITTGVVSFQKLVLEASGILHYFEELHGYLNLTRTEWSTPTLAGEKWVLIDNLTPREIGDKILWLGAESLTNKNFIQCSDYYGVEYLQLTNLIPLIDEMLL